MDFNALARMLGLPPISTGMSQVNVNPLTGQSGVYPAFYDSAPAPTGGNSDVPENDPTLEAWPDWMLGLLANDVKLEPDTPSSQDVPKNNLGTENWSQEDLMNDPINRIVRGKLGDDYGVSYHQILRDNPQITPWPTDDSVYNLEIKDGQWNGGPMPAEGAVSAPVPTPASAPAKEPPKKDFKGLMSGLKLQKPEQERQPQFAALTPHRPDPMSVKKLMEMYRGGLLR